MATYFVRTSGGSDANGGTSVADGWATVGQAISTATAGDEVRLCVMAGGEEFDISASLNFNVAGSGGSTLLWSGANSSGLVTGTVAYIDMQNTAAVTITISANRQMFQYVGFKNGNSTSGAIVSAANSVFRGCLADNNDSNGFDISSNDNAFIECMANNNGSEGFNSGSRTTMFGCVSHNNSGSGYRGSSIQSINCIAYDNSSRGWRNVHSCINCTAYNNGNDGIELTGSAQGMMVVNCLLESNSVYGIDANSDEPVLVDGNAFYNNTSGTVTGVIGITGTSVTLTSSALTDPANDDFSLNNVSGGGTEAKAAGIPDTWVQDSTIGYHDIGAVQAALRAAILTS